jgi:hypothetical protein
MPRRAQAAAALFSLALLAAGCGDANHEFRVDKLEPLRARATQQRVEVAATLQTARPHSGSDARALRRQVARLAATTRRIAALSPPAGVRKAFLRYTRANAALVASLTRFVDAFAEGTVPKQKRAGRKVRAAVSQARQREAELVRSLS